VLAVITGFCLALAVNLIVLLLVVLFWNTHRMLVIGVLAGVFSAAGLAACVMLRTAMTRRPRLLSATIAEMKKDRDALERR
jgi:uncharacterized membrane protein YqjE